jgi:predicted enzyme related to lactoylglutathione lyase
MAHTIVHFEVPADDVGRAQKFYGDLFGWTFQDVGNDYHLIQTGGEPGGGMMRRMAPEQPITNYIGVENIDEYAKKAQSLGAKPLMPKTAVPSMGWFAQFQDTEGNLFALWQEDAGAA